VSSGPFGIVLRDARRAEARRRGGPAFPSGSCQDARAANSARGWPDAAWTSCAKQQFRAQAAGYAAQFPQALSLIFLYRDEPNRRLMLQIGPK